MGIVVAAILFVFVGWAALSEKSISIPHWVNTGKGHCMRISRESDFPVVSLSVGTPPRNVKLLLRLGSVVARASDSMSIFSEELLRSETLRCSDDRRCTDTAILTSDTHGSQAIGVISFTYGNSWSGEFAIEQSVGLEGSISLVRGMLYDLSPTHFCWRNASSGDIDTSDGFEQYNISVSGQSIYMESEEITRALPENSVSCNESVLMFPVDASHERSWLALSNDFLYESSTSKLGDRRDVVERGLGCADESNEKEIYELDCSLDLQATCRTEPSLPFRRLSQFELKFKLSSNSSSSFLALKRRNSLSRLAGSNSISDSVFFALMRLVVLLIVAFVVFNRAERVSASAFSTINSAIDVANGREKHGRHTWFNALSDAAVGALAIISRALILSHNAIVLADDGNIEVVVWECVGVSASIVHYCLRHLVLKTDLEKEAPLSKLGGSMSLADACVAALLSVLHTPMLGASARDFDAVSRLFCALLIALFCVHRLFFSVAACAVLASTTASDGRFERSYSVTLWISCGLWLVQACALSFSFSRLFVVPQAYSLVRFSMGGPRQTEVALFLGSMTLSIPYLNSVCTRIAKKDRK